MSSGGVVFGWDDCKNGPGDVLESDIDDDSTAVVDTLNAGKSTVPEVPSKETGSEVR